MLAALALLLAGCAAAPGLITPPAPGPTLPTPTPIVLVATPTPIAGLDPHELRIIEVYRRYSPAVVNINTQVLRKDRPQPVVRQGLSCNV